MKTSNQDPRDEAGILPSQISPNPVRKLNVHSPLSESSLSSHFTSETTSTTCEPTLDFSNLLQRRNGTVLGRDVILKSEHFFKGMNAVESELKLLGAPNFRSTNLNIFGAAQPSASGLATILRVLGCGPDSSPSSGLKTSSSTTDLAAKFSTLSTDSTTQLSQISGPSQTGGRMKRAIWFSTREEPIIYINEQPFVVRDMASPFINIKSYSGISATRLEGVEKRLKADISHEARKNNGLLLVHDEQDDHSIMPCLISADYVKTSKEMLEDIQAKGFAVDYYRVPVSHEQSPTDPYIDEYFKIFSATPTDWPVIFSCGMGIGRTTYGMVIALLIRRAQIISLTGNDPFQAGSLPDFGGKSRTMLRLVYILEQGLQSKQSSQSAIEWILARSGMIDKLEASINGNYMVINDLVRVLSNGNFCKQIVDSAIDRCNTVVNLREHILLYRVRSLVHSGPNSSLDTGLGFLERYFSLICFCEYVEKRLFLGDKNSETTFQDWMQNHKEIWKMLTYLRSSNNKLRAFRPIDELLDIHAHQNPLLAFKSPRLQPVSEDMMVVQSRSGAVLGPNTILKIDHWTQSSTTPSPHSVFGVPEISGAPNFRKIPLGPCNGAEIYAVAQPTLMALRKILSVICEGQKGRRIVWINVREEPILYINGEPYVLRDQYASLRNIKAYTGITAARLENMELRLKEDVLSESRAYSGRILLHSEGSERDIQPIWESVGEVFTMREIFSSDDEADAFREHEHIHLLREFPQIEYFRVPITAEESPEAGDFDCLREIVFKASQVSSDNGHSAHPPILIFNCQMGVGRSTTGSVIGAQLITLPLDHHLMVHSAPHSVVHYRMITNLVRMLKNGQECKRRVDWLIDCAGTLLNLRSTIEDYRKAASKCTFDRQNCRKLVTKGLHSLKRYAMLIMHQAYLMEVQASGGPQAQDQTSGSATPSALTFATWITQHPEFGSLLKELETKRLEALTVLLEEEEGEHEGDSRRSTSNLSIKPTQLLSENEASDVEHPQSEIESEGPLEPFRTIASPQEVKSIVEGRDGSVLAAMTILKFDHFIGCQKQSLLERIEGAPNFRKVSLFQRSGEESVAAPEVAVAEKFVCGLAMPTVSAIARVLERVSCQADGERRVLWISMREEPVIFVNGNPYVLRIVRDPIVNLEMTGIVSERVELMETRLKEEAAKEVERFHGHLLLHEEDLVESTKTLAIVPEWERVRYGAGSDATTLASPAEVYQCYMQQYPLTYVRVPVTDEQAPIPNTFDELLRLITAHPHITDYIFNCQMGRGRTTTGMIITMMYYRVVAAQAPKSPLETPAATAAATNPYLEGEYKLVLKLCQMLEHGRRAKAIADECIDACAHLQNLREAIFDYKQRLDQVDGNHPEDELRTRGVNYLLRYFYLIVFAAYLLEELPASSDAHATAQPEKSFLQWLSERREITNLAERDDAINFE